MRTRQKKNGSGKPIARATRVTHRFSGGGHESSLASRRRSTILAVGVATTLLTLSACDNPPPAGQDLQTQPARGRTDEHPAHTDDDPAHAAQADGADAEHAQTKTLEAPASQPAATQPAEEPELPKYLSVLEKIDGREPYRVTARIDGPRRLVIDTGNVQRIRIDRRKLELSPSRSVRLQLDGQGVELMPSSTIIELERSRNGDWTPVKRPRKK